MAKFKIVKPVKTKPAKKAEEKKSVYRLAVNIYKVGIAGDVIAETHPSFKELSAKNYIIKE